MYGQMWLCGSIINIMQESWVFSFSLKYVYKNNEKDNGNCIKIIKIT